MVTRNLVREGSRRRLLECLLVFGALPLLLLCGIPPAWWPWLLAATGTVCAAAWLRRPARVRWRWLEPLRPGERQWLPFLGFRLALSALLLAVLVLLLVPERLFGLPRENPTLWLLLLSTYPVFSVLPQEIVYRYFFRRRYRHLFPGRAWAWPSAFAFAWLHVAFMNLLAPLLCLLAGWFFATTFRQSGSLRLTVAEHTLYGALIFSIGLGEFFFHDPSALRG